MEPLQPSSLAVDPYQAAGLLFLFLLIALIFAGYPMYRRRKDYKARREELEKKYTRLWKAHRDLVMHYDWALSRQEPPAEIQKMGREVMRMRNELEQIHQEIQRLETNYTEGRQEKTTSKVNKEF